MKKPPVFAISGAHGPRGHRTRHFCCIGLDSTAKRGILLEVPVAAVKASALWVEVFGLFGATSSIYRATLILIESLLGVHF